MDRPTKSEMMMMLAHVAKERSTCSRLQVGCVLTDYEHRIISFGYNGGPQGGRNACARETIGNCGCVHAEMNAVAIAQPGLKYAYVTTTPCEMCAVLLINYGIAVLYYDELYRDTTGVQLLDEHHVPVWNIHTEEAWDKA